MTAGLFGLKKRVLTPELMDDPALDAAVHAQALRGLEKINTVSFSAQTLWSAIQRFYKDSGKKPLRILDIACGAGDMVLKLAVRARRENLPLSFEGCDFNPQAVAYAQTRAAAAGAVGVNFFVLDALRDVIPARFDMVINSLFLHHLSEAQALLFFKTLARSQTGCIVISDLRRSRRGWLLAFLGSRLLTRSHVVHVDALLSVEAAWTPEEISALTRVAGLPSAQITFVWPMRYLLTWQNP